MDEPKATEEEGTLTQWRKADDSPSGGEEGEKGCYGCVRLGYCRCMHCLCSSQPASRLGRARPLGVMTEHSQVHVPQSVELLLPLGL